MFIKIILLMTSILFFTSCGSKHNSTSLLGHFRVDKDLFLAQFDCKTDVDDIYSVAAVATMLADPRFKDVHYHAVAGAYGIQEGLYVPAGDVFKAAFGNHWSDAHSNHKKALDEVTLIVIETLEKNGDIWIADAGQSDFTSALILNIREALSQIHTTKRIHVVQHSDWNENNTSPENLAYVKANSDYHKIPDGNVTGNGSPGFKTDEIINLQKYITNPKLIRIWDLAIETASTYNGKDNRYKNPAIANGGMDFSDASETCWIFGFNYLKDTKQYFAEFSTSSDM